MALDNKKRQKRLAKKSAKRKQKKCLIVASNNMSKMDNFAKMPIHECLINESLFETGIGNVILCRKNPECDFVVGVFLVDVFCLGVKDAHFTYLLSKDFDSLKSNTANYGELRNIAPSHARKLVENCVAYAKDLGFEPHKDYSKASRIFGNIDPGDCEDEFTFGKDGKPFFVAGPYDSTVKCNNIMKTLESKCGEGNYNYTLPLSGLE